VKRSTVSRITRRLEEHVESLRATKIERAIPYLYLDATFLDVRWANAVENVAALVAYGVNDTGHRELLGMTIGAQESEDSWSDLLKQLVGRGLHGVRLVISDEHEGLKKAVRFQLPEARRQRCYVHLLRNIGAKVPKRHQERVLREASAVFHADTRDEAKKKLVQMQDRWTKLMPEAVECLVNGFEAATQFYAFPKEHWKRLRSTNGLERLHGEIKRRTRAVGIFPDCASALRLVTATAVRVTEIWGARRYLDMSLLT
jgi:transposase-like protein